VFSLFFFLLFPSPFSGLATIKDPFHGLWTILPFEFFPLCCVCYPMILRSPTPDDRRRRESLRGAQSLVDDNVKRQRRHYESIPLSFFSFFLSFFLFFSFGFRSDDFQCGIYTRC
jgi:hypothetical protein